MAPTRRSAAPKLTIERELWADGHQVVVGMDEVGRGAWAGPLMVGAAVLPQDRRVYRGRDSKKLTQRERGRLFDPIAARCAAWAVGGARQGEGDGVGVSAAPQRGPQRGRPGA